MPTAIDHLLAIVLAAFFPIRASTFGYRRLALAAESEIKRVRRSLYLQALWIQWGLVLALAAWWMARARAWTSLGLTLPATPTFLGITAAALVGAALLLIQSRSGARDPRVLELVMRRLGNVERMLPHDQGELRVFRGLAVTAGVCEEVLYRGFLMWYLGHWLGPVPSLVAASIVFGIGHSYQGPRGVAVTALVGMVLGLLYLAAGSLLPAILLHAAGDLHSGTLAHAALSRPRSEEG